MAFFRSLLADGAVNIGVARVVLLGQPLDPVDWQTALEICRSWCHGRRRPHTVITVNAALLVMIRRDASLRAACAAGDLIVADGAPVVWSSRLVGAPLPVRIAGVDLMARLLELASREGFRVFFLGAKPEVVRDLVERCKRDFPGLIVAGYRDGYFKPEDHSLIIEQIRESRSDMLFVGMPSPFKEVWCAQHRVALGVPLVMGVGGSFDVLAGHVRRAPRWLQTIGLEWSWRLVMEPRKMWKRYLVTNVVFMWLVAGAVVRRLFRSTTS